MSNQTNQTNQTNQKPVANKNNQKRFFPFTTDKYNHKKFSLTELAKNERSEAQFIAYPRYGEGMFVFQTKEYELKEYGIPSTKYAKSAADRMTLKLALDDQPANVENVQMFKQIDDHCVNPTNKTKIFEPINLVNKKGQKVPFEYKPIIREPRESDVIEEPKEKDQNKPEKVKSNFWKAKLDTNYETGDIVTSIFVRDPENPTAKPTKADVRTIEDLEKYLTWGSKIRLIVMMNKLWAEKAPKNSKERQYGFGFKILSIETTPRVKQGSYKESISNYAFQDPEDGNGDQNDQPDNQDGDAGDDNTGDAGDDNTGDADDGMDDAGDAGDDGDDTGDAGDDGDAGDGDDDDQAVEPEPVKPEPPKPVVKNTKAPVAKPPVKAKK